MSTHTPGPWIVNAEQVFGNGCRIATINQHTSTWLEDRALIEAAPDLLAALKTALTELDTPNYTSIEAHDNLVQAARAAIAKAEGKS